MPHADSLALPDDINSKESFYAHVTQALEHLLREDEPNEKGAWITGLANASSLLYGSFENFSQVWGKEDGKRVNWSGFYLHPSLFPAPKAPLSSTESPDELLLGPFHGRPACLKIPLKSKRSLGVCATSFVKKETVVVPDVDKVPGHIACDGVTRSEIVVPIIIPVGPGRVPVPIGVLDLDCEAEGGFDEEDRKGLGKFVESLIGLVEWNL
ncbi:hypothetical protein T439DRAFT_323023 [Meredithblackwellia eburnea MCA 4105]